jgi:hypothetical protein
MTDRKIFLSLSLSLLAGRSHLNDFAERIAHRAVVLDNEILHGLDETTLSGVQNIDIQKQTCNGKE